MGPFAAAALPAIIAGGADIIGGLIGSKGQASANEQNYKIAKENRAFQERMSSTANQRAATDLKAAGLNRILALGNPASSPGGATATMQNIKAPLARGVSAAAHSAAALAKNAAEITNINATTANTKATTLLTGQRTLIATHGAEVASVAGDIARTTRILLGNKNPAQFAGIIKTQIDKAIPILTDMLEKAGNSASQISNSISGLRNSIEIMILDQFDNLKESLTPISEAEAKRRLDEVSRDNKNYNR